LFGWFYRIITKKKTQKKTKNKKQKITRKRFCNLYLSELETRLIDDKREEEKVNVYEMKFQSIYRETNSKEIALSLLFFILMLTAYKREEIT
jgi:ascorbate-specific PTS system EIIC-type component UlaA